MAAGCTSTAGQPPKNSRERDLTCTLEEQLPIAEPPHESFVVFPPCHCQGVGLGVQAHAKHRRCPKRQSVSGQGSHLRFCPSGPAASPPPSAQSSTYFLLGKEGRTHVLQSFKRQVAGEIPPQACQGTSPFTGHPLTTPDSCTDKRSVRVCKASSSQHGLGTAPCHLPC